MYMLKPGIKRRLEEHWSLPDRIFFGYGACHILAGVYARRPPLAGFHAERLVPTKDLPGNHIYLTNGEIAFDYHGYSTRSRLLAHHRKGWSGLHQDWDCVIETVGFDLLGTRELNLRRMRGPDQYWMDPIPRALQFIGRIDRRAAFAKAAGTHSHHG